MSSLVYIVDDDASFRTAVERRLKLAGYEVEKHSSAQTLLDRLQGSEGPGCVLLDVRMPGLNGLELQSRLIELHSMLPVIFVTGYADIPTTVQAIRAGAEDLLIKPVSSEQLIGAIERALARHELVRSQRSKLDASSRTSCEIDAPRATGLRFDRARKDQQASCQKTWNNRTHRESASP